MQEAGAKAFHRVMENSSYGRSSYRGSNSVYAQTPISVIKINWSTPHQTKSFIYGTDRSPCGHFMK